MSKPLLLLFTGVAIGALAAWGLHPSGQAHADVACPQVTAPAAQRAGLEATQIRIIVRDELARALNGSPAAAARPDPDDGSDRAPIVAAATPEQLRALDDARRLVEAARGTRRWTKDADSRLQGLMPQLDDAQRNEILGDLFSALNRDEVVPDFAGGPLSR
ncbi:MAG TPA: hypothetical protein VFS15_13930 [Kofleriaceae bacterium]|nr:hypothetical protein [Kofleriaceae bacterium]